MKKYNKGLVEIMSTKEERIIKAIGNIKTSDIEIAVGEDHDNINDQSLKSNNSNYTMTLLSDKKAGNE